MYQIPTQSRDFFDWKEYRDAGLIKEGGFTIITGGRDIGKTTGSLIAWLREASPDEMVFYGRNSLKELEQYARTFNDAYGEEFYMTKNAIWTVERIELLNKKTKQIEIEYRKKDVIGYLGSLNGTDGWRSANFNKIKYIFFDEFNQIGNSLNTQKFITLWTSILRTKQNVYTLIIGNRDDASSDLVVELGINIMVPENYEGDWVIPLLPHDEKFKDKCYFIDLDDNRFNNNKVPTIWKAIGRQTTTMGSYYDRGYKSYENSDCKKLTENVMSKITWDFGFWGDIKLLFGKLEDIYIVHHDKDEQYDVKPTFASIPTCAKKPNLIPITHNINYIFNYISPQIKNENVLYTSILAKEECNFYISDWAYDILGDENIFKL